MKRPRAPSARRWAQAGLTLLVYGGGRVGLMCIIADAVLATGGRAIGVIPKLLVDKEVGHHGLTELHVVPDIAPPQEEMMVDLSDAFVAMPGGTGTLEEFSRSIPGHSSAITASPVALLNVEGFYDPLVTMLRHTVEEGFMAGSYVESLCIDANSEGLLDQRRRYQRRPRATSGRR